MPSLVNARIDPTTEVPQRMSLFDLSIIAIAVVVAAFLAFSRWVGHSSAWKATVTPLASIMGSGFLVSAPLLGGIVGNLAWFCMAALLLLAYSVGGAIRFNIQHFEPIEHEGHGPAQGIAFLSRVVLAAAYFISVTYYLQLLAAFLLKSVGLENDFLEHCITTAILLVIGGIGMYRGLGMLEGLEKYAVAVNLGMIVSLLFALSLHNLRLFAQGEWSLPEVSSGIDTSDLRVLLGLLIVVQGFETSRYLGDEHSADERIATMRAAQLISTVIYLVFIGLATVLFRPNMGADVTDIITMTAPVAMVLPILLSVAAIGSQFSAAVADNEGAGGLIEDITHRNVPIRYAYLLILIVTIGLTWETDVNQIIAYASRAFALFYCLQCVVASVVASNLQSLKHQRLHVAFYAALALICLIVFLFGTPAA